MASQGGALACHPSDPHRTRGERSPAPFPKLFLEGNLDLKTPFGRPEGGGMVWEAAGKLLPCVLQTRKKWHNQERGSLPPYLTLQLFYRNVHSVSPRPCPGSRVTCSLSDARRGHAGKIRAIAHPQHSHCEEHTARTRSHICHGRVLSFRRLSDSSPAFPSCSK